jgi:hypothetical protein
MQALIAQTVPSCKPLIYKESTSTHYTNAVFSDK